MKYFTGEWFSDDAIMCEYIRDMVVVSGTDRNNILRVKPSEGGSNLYGYTWRSYLTPTRNRTPSKFHNLWNTKLLDDYPEFHDIAKEFRDLHFKNFKYSQIQINKNYPIPPHKDSKNVGESVLCSFGDYTGGDTIVDLGKTKIRYDARLKPIKFNGSKFTHWVEPFEGYRYSLVYFNNLKNREGVFI